MKKQIVLLFTVLLSMTMYSQELPKISKSQKNMSLGTHTGHKIVFPYQNLGTGVKIIKNGFKDLNAEEADVPKESNEIIFTDVYLNNVSKPLKVVSVVEQEGRNVGWTSYYFDNLDKDIEEDVVIEEFIKKQFNTSMRMVYDDSIKIQTKTVSREEKKLEDLIDNASDSKKGLNKNATQISGFEDKITQSQNNITSLNSKMATLTESQRDAESMLTAANGLQGEVNNMEAELKGLNSSHKDMLKHLSKLQKDPGINASLIAAQNEDIARLNKKINEKQQNFSSRSEVVKQEIKMAEDRVKSVKKDIKNTQKAIDKEQKNITNYKNKITDMNEENNAHTNNVSTIESTEKTKQEEAIKAAKEKLNYYTEIQGLYK